MNGATGRRFWQVRLSTLVLSVLLIGAFLGMSFDDRGDIGTIVGWPIPIGLWQRGDPSIFFVRDSYRTLSFSPRSSYVTWSFKFLLAEVALWAVMIGAIVSLYTVLFTPTRAAAKAWLRTRWRECHAAVVVITAAAVCILIYVNLRTGSIPAEIVEWESHSSVDLGSTLTTARTRGWPAIAQVTVPVVPRGITKVTKVALDEDEYLVGKTEFLPALADAVTVVAPIALLLLIQTILSGLAARRSKALSRSTESA